MSNPKFILSFLGGFAVIAAAFGLIHGLQRESPEDALMRKGAANMHVPVREYRDLMEAFRHIEDTHKATNQDWAEIQGASASSYPSQRETALGACAFLLPGDPHQAEAIRFAKNFLASNMPAGNLPAILTLRSLKDPSW